MSRAARWWPVVALVALAVVLIVVGLFYLEQPVGKVNVSSIHLVGATDPCGLNGGTLKGFVADEGASVRESVTVHNANASSDCAIRSVTSATSGFSVSDFTPVAIPSEGNGTLAFTLQVPDSAFNGPITLDLA